MSNANLTLTQIAEQQRNALMSSNNYDGSPSDEYGSSHPNALSDGDEPGKGDTGTIGGTTDILTRTNNTSSNQFGPTNEYPNF